MSWDVSLYHFSKIYTSIAQIPQDEQPLVLGSRREIHVAVLASFPGTDWTDPVWGIFDAPYGSVEFNIGKEEPVASIGLHIRASSEIIDHILHLCAAQKWQAIDLSDGSFLEQVDQPSKNLVAWQAYRDQIVGSNGAA